MNKYLTDDCINCNKFSHCNNNNLICISKYKIKEQECEKLKKRLESFQKDYSKLYQVVENKGYIKELDQLKAEKEEIKKYLGINHKTILERLEELTDFRDRDKEELDQLKAELEQLKTNKG